MGKNERQNPRRPHELHSNVSQQAPGRMYKIYPVFATEKIKGNVGRVTSDLRKGLPWLLLPTTRVVSLVLSDLMSYSSLVSNSSRCHQLHNTANPSGDVSHTSSSTPALAHLLETRSGEGTPPPPAAPFAHRMPCRHDPNPNPMSTSRQRLPLPLPDPHHPQEGRAPICAQGQAASPQPPDQRCVYQRCVH